jgi:tripartite-type tricarboxylate transporter receptor subunit TctC
MVLNSARSSLILASLFCAMPVGHALAQSYPSKPIRMVLPFPAGGPSDIVGRALGKQLSDQLGVSVVIDNRAGAGGNVGLSAAAKLEPDGYNIAVTTPGIALSQSLYKKLGYDPKNDFVPIARLASIENLLVVHPSVPAKTLREFVALARKNPGRLNYGSGGAGTTNHLANELLKSLQKINMVHVPYKGATMAAVALIGGEVDEVVVSVPSSLPFIQAGKLRPLAVLAEKRAGPLPDVPTSTEEGMPEFKMSIWYGLLAPKGLPANIAKRLHDETIKALNSPALRKQLTRQGIEPWPGSGQEMSSLISSETKRFAGIVSRAGLKKR